jgi:L-lactate permease
MLRSRQVAAYPQHSHHYQLWHLLFTLAVRRIPAWKASLIGLTTATLVALFMYHMPIRTTISTIAYGVAFGLFPICWIVFWAIVLYRLSLESGKFEVIKDSIGGLTRDPQLQALLIAFALGAFIEGACGFGTPVAVAAAMLTGLGFSHCDGDGIASPLAVRLQPAGHYF